MLEYKFLFWNLNNFLSKIYKISIFSSSTIEREVSVSPMSNLSRLLNDDELLRETPAIKLQLRHTDEEENVMRVLVRYEA